MNICNGPGLPRGALVVLATAILLTNAPAAAEPPSYKYLEVAYGTANLDIGISGLGLVSIDLDGYGLDGSFSFLDDRIWIFGSYVDSSGDGQGVDFDAEAVRLGLGWIVPAGASATIDASLIYRRDEISAQGLSGEIDGLGAAVGIRGDVELDQYQLGARVTF